MPLTAKAGQDFETVEAGVYKGRCIKIIDLGTHDVTWQEETQSKHKVIIMFELPETCMKKEPNRGKPFAVSLFISLSLHKKSNLRPLLVGWRGKDFTEEEAKNFDILKLLDVPALINVIHNERDGNVYANIANIMPLKKKECPIRINPLLSFSLESFDQKIFESLSENLQKKITSSEEYIQLTTGQGMTVTEDDKNVVIDITGDDVKDEEIPF
ncbi:hypothetical protein LCGC14_1961370 [marine sediment metagenome]|uniref:Uncharacterized protein n=1 Tax=marine sediment metagenome TaxID=412755 RepID=A0A0F9G2W8_9ZZZZ